MSKGSNISSASGMQSGPCSIGQAGRGIPDVDASALLLRDDGRVSSDDDFVFYNQPQHPSGAVRHAGKSGTQDTVGGRARAAAVVGRPDRARRIRRRGRVRAGAGPAPRHLRSRDRRSAGRLPDDRDPTRPRSSAASSTGGPGRGSSAPSDRATRPVWPDSRPTSASPSLTPARRSPATSSSATTSASSGCATARPAAGCGIRDRPTPATPPPPGYLGPASSTAAAPPAPATAGSPPSTRVGSASSRAAGSAWSSPARRR